MKEMFHSRSATELSALPHKSSSSHQLSRLGSTASQKVLGPGWLTLYSKSYLHFVPPAGHCLLPSLPASRLSAALLWACTLLTRDPAANLLTPMWVLQLGAAPAPRAVDCVPTMPRSQSTSSLASLRRRCSTQALAEMGLSLPPDLARQAEELVRVCICFAQLLASLSTRLTAVPGTGGGELSGRWHLRQCR